MNVQPVDTILISLGGQFNASTFHARHIDAIQRAAPHAQIVVVQNRNEWEQLSKEMGKKVQVGLGQWIWGSSCQQVPNLKWFHQNGSGVDWLFQSPEIASSRLLLTNSAGTNVVPIAEHVITFMLVFSRGFHHHLRRQSQHGWNRGGVATELEGTTLGLIGVGRIGAKVAEKAKRMKLHVIGLRRNPGRSDLHVDKMFGPTDLHKLLALSDWVVIAAALTAETIGMIGAKEIKAMKPSAHLINVARGALVQEKALVEALKKGWIAGAGLDVFEEEPLSKDSPLWDLDNVVITPHHSSASPGLTDRLIELFVDNLRRYQSGSPLVNVVDKQRGY